MSDKRTFIHKGLPDDLLTSQEIDERRLKVESETSESELIEFHEISEKHPKNKIPFLAKRFAAKEAISKALGTGMRKGIDFVQLSISHDVLGKPMVTLSGKAQVWAKQNNIEKIQVTISDEKHYAVAFAVAET